MAELSEEEIIKAVIIRLERFSEKGDLDKNKYQAILKEEGATLGTVKKIEQLKNRNVDRAYSYLEEGEFKEAVREAQRAVNKNPFDRESRLLYLDTLLSRYEVENLSALRMNIRREMATLQALDPQNSDLLSRQERMRALKIPTQRDRRRNILILAISSSAFLVAVLIISFFINRSNQIPTVTAPPDAPLEISAEFPDGEIKEMPLLTTPLNEEDDVTIKTEDSYITRENGIYSVVVKGNIKNENPKEISFMKFNLVAYNKNREKIIDTPILEINENSPALKTGYTALFSERQPLKFAPSEINSLVLSKESISRENLKRPVLVAPKEDMPLLAGARREDFNIELEYIESAEIPTKTGSVKIVDIGFYNKSSKPINNLVLAAELPKEKGEVAIPIPLLDGIGSASLDGGQKTVKRLTIPSQSPLYKQIDRNILEVLLLE